MARADGSYWAPVDCVAPPHPAFASKAEAGPHRRKLYTVYVKDIASYAAISGQDFGPPAHGKEEAPEVQAMSQVIVKEAWSPVESSLFHEQCQPRGAPSLLDQVVMEGKEYRACERVGLFIMYRPAAPTDGADEGWIYGTVLYEPRPARRRGQRPRSPA